MEHLFVKLNKKEKVKIDKGVFVDLLDLSHIKEYKDYSNAMQAKEVTLDVLRKLAAKSGIPYPLFFAPKEVVAIQIEDKNKNLYEKIPGKDELRLNSRGRVEIQDIELIVKDLGRKQEFLKNRVLPKTLPNEFIGSITAKLKKNVSVEKIATEIREYFGINLAYLRNVPKDGVLTYLTACVERKGILVSFSAYNYMPQNIAPELELSGICIKDKKFPYIFINTRDGDEKPKIIESSGRQIFTLLSMLGCIAMGKFVLSSKTGPSNDGSSKLAYTIAGEILVPKIDLTGIQISTLEELKQKAHFFKVTPSMLLYRLRENKNMKPTLANAFQQQLRQEVKKAEPKHKHAPLPMNAYGKYNGERFSKEVIKAYNAGAISQMEVKNILFRKGKMDTKLLSDYSRKFI